MIQIGYNVTAFDPTPAKKDPVSSIDDSVKPRIEGQTQEAKSILTETAELSLADANRSKNDFRRELITSLGSSNGSTVPSPFSALDSEKKVESRGEHPSVLEARQRFGGQYFLGSLGNEGNVTPPSENSDPLGHTLQFHNTNQELSFNFPEVDTNKYHLHEATVTKVAGKTMVASISLVEHNNINVELSHPIPSDSAYPILATIESALEKFTGGCNAPVIEARYDLSSGVMKVITDEAEYLVYENNLYIRTEESPERNIRLSEITSLKAKADEIISNLVRLGFENLQDFKQWSERYLERVQKFGKETQFSITYGSRSDYEKLTPEQKAEVSALRKEDRRYSDARRIIGDYERQISLVREVENTMTTLKEYVGLQVSGIVPTLSTEERNGALKVQIRDENGLLMHQNSLEDPMKEQYMYGHLGDAGHFRQRHTFSDGVLIKSEQSLSLLPDLVREKVTYSSSGDAIISESYDEKGELFQRTHHTHNFKEYWNKNEPLYSIAVTDKFWQPENLTQIVQLPNAEEIFFAAAEVDPLRAILRISPLIGKTQEGRWLEFAIGKLTQDQIDSLRKEFDYFKELAESSDSFHAPAHITPLAVEILSFRERMLKEGAELVRTVEAANRDPGTSLALWNDPSSRGYFDIQDTWIQWNSPQVVKLLHSDSSALARADLKLNVARLLFQNKLPITPDTVQEALSQLEGLRENFRHLSLFKGRNVVLAAHSEILPPESIERGFHEMAHDKHAFAKVGLVERFKQEQGGRGTFSTIRAELGDDELTIAEKSARLRAAKEQILHEIRTTPPPFTFVFEGHGSPDRICLSDGEIDSDGNILISDESVVISSEEFAEALKTRHLNFGPVIDGAYDIIVFQNCYSANFVRHIGEQLHGVRTPVFLGAAEFDQVSIFSYPSEIGAAFLGEVVSSSAGGDSTIGDVLERQYKDLQPFYESAIQSTSQNPDGVETYDHNADGNTNPVILVPDANGVLRQIGSKQEPNPSNDPSRSNTSKMALV